VKRPVRATHLATYVGTNRRRPPDMPKPEDNYIIARFRKDDEPDRLVITEITPAQIIQFLAAMPTLVTAFVCEAATAQAERTKAGIADAPKL
jgi:hypothetical protein